jgi:hypothetical protein
MIDKTDILKKIGATNSGAPASAFAEEIASNRSVTGNLNSQYQFTQTVDKENGITKLSFLGKAIKAMGGVGNIVGTVGLGAAGSALGNSIVPVKTKGESVKLNKYLNKIASVNSAAPIAVKPNVLNKIGLGLSLASLGISGANFMNNRANIKQDAARRNLEEKSLKALNNISRTLASNQNGTN